tara:strand:- start:184 stop:435 length:252 start_codon:yes stop_codon:yes gene_type:complete
MIKRRRRERLRSDRKRHVQAVPEGQDDIDRHRSTVVRATKDDMAVARASPPQPSKQVRGEGFMAEMIQPDTKKYNSTSWLRRR